MSDQSPPPKPKVGSLRDRIAAFEKPNASSAPGPPPAPRPKPGGLQWKPKSPSPPPSPGLSASEHTLAPKVGGMSASDAKESIGKGGSLRERMAALQGKGAFGAPPVTAPKPAVEKPKWKPPPVISPPEEDETATSETAHDANPSHESLKSANIGHSASDEPSHPLSDEEHTPAAEGEEPAEADPEEEERQRRAAIAARMARLGGARVGMAPPIFGKKPPVKKVETPKEELPTQEITPVEPPLQNTPSISPPTDETSIQPSDKPDEDSPDNAFELTKSPPSSIHSPDSGSHTARIPTAMPVPAGPRRAAPPRRKAAAKTLSPAPAPVIPDKEVKESLPTTATSDSGPAVEPEPVTSDVVGIEPKETEEKIVEEDIVEPIPESPEKITEETTSEEPLGKERESTKALESSVPSVDPVSLSHAPDFIEDVATRPADTEAEPERKPSFDTPISLPTAEIPVKLSEETADLSHELDEEAEEAARRKRVAEKLAKMGGINPFAPPPPVQRQPSTNIISDESPSQAITSAEISARVEPVARKSSVDSTTVASSPLLSQEAVKESSAVQPPSRKNSADSTRSGGTSVSRKNSQDESHPLKQPEIRKDTELGIPEEIETTYDADEEEHDSQLEQSIDDEREISAASAEQSIPRDDNEEEETPIPSEHHHEQPESPREDSTGILAAPALAPLPNLSTRPDVVPPRPALHSPRDDNDVSEPLQTPPRRSMPPPPRVIPQSPVRDEDEEAPEHFSSPRRSIPPAPQSPVVEYMKEPAPMRTLPPRPVIQSEDEQDAIESDSVALPHPHRQSKPPPPRSIPNAPDDDNGLELVSSPRRSIPPPPPVPQTTIIDEEEEEEEAEVPEQEIPLPTPPRRPIPSHSEGSSEDADEEASPVPPPPVRDSVQSHFEETVPPPAEIALSDEEILDESEGDPIDPAFHSPSRKTSTAHMKLPVADHEPETETEEDAEQNRRRTIAERMAKLGGIRFGAVPIRPHAATPQSEEPTSTSETPIEEGEEQPELTEEQEEQARKQRIAAKLAGMGGMRFGMLPSGAGGMPRQQPPRASVEPVETVSSPPPPPSRALPPSRPPPSQSQSQSQSQETDSEYESQTTSDDGVQVEAEESELEEVSHEDAEEAPPPVPSRQGRHESVPASFRAEHAHASRAPSGRPPVPSTSTIPNRRSSAQPTRKESTDSNATQSPPRKSSAAAQAQQQQQQSEYVMVEDPVRSDEDEDEVPPPPPPRVTRPISRAPVRDAPLPPPPPAAADDSLADSHWELPSIPTPTIDFGATTDLSLSTWSEDSTSYPAAAAAAAASPSPPPAAKPFQAVSKPLPENVNLTSEELMVVWGRVGVQICEVATALFEKSKKALIGDGTYDGFVNAVLSEVPTAAASSPPSYGYLIYVQNGSAVQKRASEIMPGDIVALFDAKLKGHKGLQIYHQNVGSAEEPLLGIVTEFEPKKSKIKVLQANQHVGQQTVESTSYRLEDLKTGIVKVFRVPEAV